MIANRYSTLIIAEAGVNHNGQLDLALELVRAAAEAGADMVKFQTFRAEDLCVREAPLAQYQERTGLSGQFEMLKALELSREDYVALIQACREHGITFLSTPFDLESARMLDELDVQTFKLSSGEVDNLPLLRMVGGLGRRVILSTGMAGLAEVEQAVSAMERAGLARENLALLHCTSAYPAPMDSVNLRAMRTLADHFPGVDVGYSDHTTGLEVAVAAVAMGAKIVEKHLTLDRDLPGPDHKASATPEELAELIRVVRNVETALGDGVKTPSASETDTARVARKVLVADAPILAGETFTPDNVSAKRAGTPGLSPMLWDQVMGCTATQDFRVGDPIDITDKE